ncbi:MucR family transcriptional regulator [Labrys miyagiensis]|uniref:MucR family transcriptional regulator n=1 Tax=Labrys miyagiensis TaxID=346912 RepID=A0ABQ6CPG9_9HYPH|nr:MucR family transcriptional regulator [Labrys miyagiensis]GLS20800.1 MucR family transcriptional regulator [Labrys miyagiensis]
MDTSIAELTSDIVAAYVAHNSVASADLPELIAQTHRALDRLARGETAVAVEAPKLVPAVPIRKSVTPDFLISLEDGKKYKSLKRHLSSQYGMSPAEYREKWGLPDDYPMVAPNYAKQRSELAKSMGLGQTRARSRSRGR